MTKYKLKIQCSKIYDKNFIIHDIFASAFVLYGSEDWNKDLSCSWGQEGKTSTRRHAQIGYHEEQCVLSPVGAFESCAECALEGFYL